MEEVEITYEWPEEYPNGVPPEDSVPAKGKAFRLVDKFPPDENDFLMYIEESRYKGDKSNNAKVYGVSLYTEYESILEARSIFPALKLKEVAVGKLIPDLGKISKPNKSNHFDLWKCRDSKPHLHINKKYKVK